MSIRFDSIFGQDKTIQRLRAAYRAERLPHGLIFAGPSGVGKQTTARALGALFLCENPNDAEPCGNCESCRGIAGGTHPDYHVIYKELIRVHDKTGKSKGIDLSINVIRPELVDKAGRMPVLNRGKVFVIEQADYMTVGAQNAMLKTLEEPPGRTLIILLTESLEALLPTIRSRCQAFSFATLPETVLRQQLSSRGYSPPDIDAAVAISEGSLGDAMRWLDDGVVAASSGLMQRLDAIESGDVASDLADWFKKAADAYAEKQLERDPLTSKDQASRAAMALYLRLAAQRFRLRLRDGEQSAEAACAAIDALARAELLLDGNVTVGLVFQQLSITLSRLYQTA